MAKACRNCCAADLIYKSKAIRKNLIKKKLFDLIFIGSCFTKKSFYPLSTLGGEGVDLMVNHEIGGEVDTRKQVRDTRLI